MNFKELTIGYLSSVEYEQLEHSSQQSYKSWLNRMPETATQDYQSLYAYLKGLPMRAATKNKGLSAIRMVYRWGLKHGHIGFYEDLSAPIKSFRQTQVRPRGFTADEVEMVCEQAETDTERVCADYLRVLFWTGARPAEIRNLRWSDIDYEKNLIAIRGAKKREKGTISRYCNLLPLVLDIFQRVYDNQKRRVENGWVFTVPVSMPNRQISKQLVGKRLQSMSRRAGVNKSACQTRPGLATAMLADGYSLIDVQHTLGHRCISTTQRYIRLSEEEKARSFTGLN